MTSYLAKRVAQSVAVVIGVMIVTFVLIHMVPGSAARSALGVRASAQRVAIFNATYGLNEPLPRQFASYVGQVLSGNFGVSYTLQEPVRTLIAQRLPKDCVLLGLSTILALAIGLPMGMLQAVRRNRLSDHLMSGVAFTLYSMPDFLLAVLLIALCCVQFHWLPPEAPQASSVAGILGDPRALVLPVVTLALVSIASFSRYMRSAALETLAMDYLNTARAKGLPERLVLLRHALRNSLLPVITILGLSLPGIVAGAVIAEEVFNYPGMGLLFYNAATSHDFPVMLGCTLIVGVATVAGNLLADVAYAILDPRIRYGHR
ncbi:MAG TPA: ABC transporter permease [Trebonia sp.]|nr:ABC transporter permease [Trebonia sp.]